MSELESVSKLSLAQVLQPENLNLSTRYGSDLEELALRRGCDVNVAKVLILAVTKLQKSTHCTLWELPNLSDLYSLTLRVGTEGLRRSDQMSTEICKMVRELSDAYHGGGGDGSGASRPGFGTAIQHAARVALDREVTEYSELLRIVAELKPIVREGRIAELAREHEVNPSEIVRLEGLLIEGGLEKSSDDALSTLDDILGSEGSYYCSPGTMIHLYALFRGNLDEVIDAVRSVLDAERDAIEKSSGRSPSPEVLEVKFFRALGEMQSEKFERERVLASGCKPGLEKVLYEVTKKLEVDFGEEPGSLAGLWPLYKVASGLRLIDHFPDQVLADPENWLIRVVLFHENQQHPGGPEQTIYNSIEELHKAHFFAAWERSLPSPTMQMTLQHSADLMVRLGIKEFCDLVVAVAGSQPQYEGGPKIAVPTSGVSSSTGLGEYPRVHRRIEELFLGFGGEPDGYSRRRSKV